MKGLALGNPRLWLGLTFATSLGTVLITFLGVFVRDEITRGVYPTVAGVTALYLMAIFGIPFLIQRIDLRVKGWVPWAAGVATLIATLGFVALWWLDRWGLGYQWTQSLKIITAPYGWGDLKLYFQWLTCQAEGINPITAPGGVCTPNPMDYGPGFLWWSPLSALSPLADLLGVATAVISALAITWLARRSAPLGAIALVIAAVSPAWLLLVERANFDELIIWLAIFLVVITRRFTGMWPWIVGAVLIWILGTWKYFPFGMVLALIPVLRLRRGWILITAFLVAAAAYLTINWNIILGGMSNHMGRGGGVGRNTLAAFPAGLEKASSGFGWSDALALFIVALAAIWGITTVRALGSKRVRGLEAPAMLASVGAISILGSVTLAGAGWNYKAALLLLGIPLAAALTRNTNPTLFRSGLIVIGLILAANFVGWNPFTSSLSLHLSAGFLIGSSLYTLVRIAIPSSQWNLGKM